MTLLALIIALVLEQIYPLGRVGHLWSFFPSYLNYVKRSCNSGLLQHGVFAWLIVVVPILLFVLFGQLLLNSINPFLGLFWEVLALYLTMGFRCFSGSFSDMSSAVNEGRMFDAREALNKWSGESTSNLSSSEMVCLAIEQGVLDSYRHVFATMFWFAVFGVFGFGSVGAVLYQLARVIKKNWSSIDEEEKRFALVSSMALSVLDWLPSRFCAASFAVVGNFEDTVYLWRAQGEALKSSAEKILLASASGAIGLKLVGAFSHVQNVYFPIELTLDEQADTLHMKRMVGLIWRSVVLWCFVMLLMTVVHFIS